MVEEISSVEVAVLYWPADPNTRGIRSVSDVTYRLVLSAHLGIGHICAPMPVGLVTILWFVPTREPPQLEAGNIVPLAAA